MNDIPRRYKVIFADGQELIVTSFDIVDATGTAIIKYVANNPNEEISEIIDIIALVKDIPNITGIINELFRNKDHKL